MVHNVFRIKEWLFGCHSGIRAEARTIQSGDRILREFYTFEALLAHTEQVVYRKIKELFNFKFKLGYENLVIYKPSFVTGQMGTLGTPYVFAIAHDATTLDEAAASTSPDTTASHTSTGSNRGMLFGLHSGGNTLSDATSITWNSSGLTNEIGLSNNQRRAVIWSLIAPSTGSQTGVVTWSGTVNEKHYAITTYTNVDQTDMVDATGTAAMNSSSSVSCSVTTNSDNSWVVVMAASRETKTWSISTGTELFNDDGGAGGVAIRGGYNATTTAGSYSVTWGITGGIETGPMVGVELVNEDAAAGGGFTPKFIGII